jgi:hypothetical protein
MRLPILIMLLVAAASPPADAHDWYTGLHSPSGIDCCGRQECRPVPYRLNEETGQEEIEANEAWWPVEYDKVLPFFSPDGSAHACWIGPWGKPFFRCIILPGMASLELDQPSPSAVRTASSP